MTATTASGDAAPHRRQRRLIDGHFSGRGSPAGEREMRQHLVGCADCRGHYGRRLRLAALDPEVALPARERLARGLGLAAAGAGAARGWRAGALSLSAAAGVAMLALALLGHRASLRAPLRVPLDAPSAARGGPAAPRGQLLAYEIAPGGAARPALSAVRSGSALAFAYANIAHKRRLMVFAVDGERRVYWYSPAWQRAAENPVAVDIAQDDAIHELPQAITHRFGRGGTAARLQIFGVFLDRPMSVREMEALVAGAAAAEPGRIRLAVPGGEVTSLDLRLVDGP
jgi:hypothetical protein